MQYSKLRLIANDSITFKEIKKPEDGQKPQEDLKSAGK